MWRRSSRSTSLGAARALNEHGLALIDILEYDVIHRVDETSARPISSSGRSRS